MIVFLNQWKKPFKNASMITEHSELEGIQKDHQVQLVSGPYRDQTHNFGIIGIML